MMASKPGLRVVDDGESPPRRTESPVKLFQSAIADASNDEAVELVYRLLENLSERCQNAADIAIDSNNRDVENEALVFIRGVDSILPMYYSNKRLQEPHHVVDAATEDLEKAMRNRCRRLLGDRTALESFSHRRQHRISSAWEVEARRESLQRERLIERADVTRERVLEALKDVATEGPVQAMQVAIAILPELADPSIVGRQAVISRVGQHLRGLAKSGNVAQIRPAENDDMRKTCRYGLAEAAGGDDA